MSVAGRPAVAVDVGGTSIKAALVLGAEVLREERVPTPVGDAAGLFEAIAAAVRALEPSPVLPLGVGWPGEVDVAGVCHRLPNLPGLRGVPVAAELQRRLGVPVVLENDATTAALGELVHGHGRTYGSFALVTLGTGVGGGLVLDGRLRRGRLGFAGEAGHVTIDTAPTARRCGCGQRGCVEAYAGAPALLARYAELGGSAASVALLVVAARDGEGAARRVLDELGAALGELATVLQNLLDLDALVIGGGVGAALPAFEGALRERLRARAFAPPLAEVPVLRSELGEHAGVIGAALLPSR